MPNNQVEQDGNSRVNEIDDSVKFENDTNHIEGNLKAEEQDGIVAISEAENKRLRRKIHARSVFFTSTLNRLTPRILPLMCMAYMIQALDKGVIGPASIMGWLPDIGTQGQDYALTSTILWIGIIAGEPLVSYHWCDLQSYLTS